MKALYNLGKLSFITGLVVETVYFATVTFAQSVTEQRICRQSGEYVVFAKHPLFINADVIDNVLETIPGLPAIARNRFVRDFTNTDLTHEHIFFCNNRMIVDNVGFGPGNRPLVESKGNVITVTLPGDRFSYSANAIRTGQEGNGGRVDNFVPIDNKRYDSDTIKSVLAGATAILPDRCEIRRSNDGIYGGVVNNCQGWTAKVREAYWKRIFVGTWEAQISNNRYQMRVTWNSAANRYEGVLTQQGQGSQEVGFSIGELGWTATLASDLSQMNEKQKWRWGSNGVSTRSEWRDGIVDLDRSTVDNLIGSTPFRRVGK
ncbi:hypothetical protein [Argonema antarcticum]|uniref:hypothetical protein n=1 Tax=Argonema antarcticum TaxID=2942763 RepID=UPI002012D826|nr:hypothetical protein [Argonema antarcticum]MCL1472046.1 hypothetical protein [Argonema antarcticum A004/B2]